MDRMELIRVSGYDLPEKMQIAKHHLLPKTFNQAGLEGFQDKVEDSALESLIRWHCREAGVRNLEKQIEKISRKLAFKVVQLAEEATRDEKRIAAEEEISTEANSNASVNSDSSSSEEENMDGVQTPALGSSSSSEAHTAPESIVEEREAKEESVASKSADAARHDESSNELSTLQRMIDDDDSNGNGEKKINKATDDNSEKKIHIATEEIPPAEETTPKSEEMEQKKEEEPIVRSIASTINKDDIENITAENLSTYAGKPVFTSDRLYETTTPAGVVMGLAWTSMGGSSLYIESVASKGKGTVEVTGQLGSVMTESTKIAKTVTKTVLGNDSEFFEVHHVHLHVPEGAIPKDGPSAGVTMVSAMLSLATNTPVIPDMAMTGEITLLGKVLPVGGIKEKTIAARRSGVKTLIVPKGNEKDINELPEYLKEGLSIHFASEYEDVRKIVFPQGYKVDEKAQVDA